MSYVDLHMILQSYKIIINHLGAYTCFIILLNKFYEGKITLCICETTLYKITNSVITKLPITQKNNTWAMGKEHELPHDNVGYKNLIQTNPMPGKLSVRRFHHVEFWCHDATNAAHRFSWALGMPIIAKSDLSTGNTTHASYLLSSGQLLFLFTAPYPAATSATATSASIPTFSHAACRAFTASHGLAVRSIAIEVEDAAFAYSISLLHGAKPSSPPVTFGEPDNTVVVAEIQLYNDVVLRYITYTKPNITNIPSTFLPGFQPFKTNTTSHYHQNLGIRGLDHVAVNVPKLAPAVHYLKSFTGFHEFAEFTANEVGTTESGLNSVILASNNEAVILGINEPVNGSKRSQIQTFLDYNDGPGVQHLALESEDIFWTLREMKRRSGAGGFEFMPPPPPSYYRRLEKRVGDVLTGEQMKECEELGVLVDRDHEGTLLQVFTKPVGDRPTIFIEVIQRIGCMLAHDSVKVRQKPGCGGFGKGNIAELFKSVEEYEKTHVINN
ncbi:putative 4-hydroxyphenylpyruvate dioxygenase [Helianthus annuus]|uniref:4-hydroxyphenylpyruvate dioxygenase n=2 Tax=Helianthus annuus TaxID=4232 RepID=A0A251VJ25_HELAN|nr:putative 4-hydroxyphenylpyruvate dioxygenase [Helianthus annuus]